MLKWHPSGVKSLSRFYILHIQLLRWAQKKKGIMIGFYTRDVIEWKHFPRYRSFVRGIHRSPMDFPHKGQWHGALMCSLICAWTNDWVNNRDAGDLRRHRVNYDVTVMRYCCPCFWWKRWWRWWRHDGMTTTAMIIRDDYAVMLITLSLASLKALKTRRYICH